MGGRTSIPTMLAAAAALPFAVASCTTDPTWYDQMRDPNSAYYAGTAAHEIMIDQAVLERLTPGNSRLEVDLGEQKARLYRVENGSRIVAVETPVSSGKEGYRTPSGNFSVLEKLSEKTSTLYGIWIDPQTGSVVDRDGDARRPPGGRSDLEFRGAPMPLWLRLTNDGVGLHVGYVPDQPASHGCIRIPRRAQQVIFQKVSVGTPVAIRG